MFGAFAFGEPTFGDAPVVTTVTPSGVVFRRTLSPVGTRVGSRQVLISLLLIASVLCF